jgi:hypothetical protein
VFNVNRDELIANAITRHLAILETSVTVPVEKIDEINALVENGSEIAMSEAKRLCEEELGRIEESGLCPMGKYDVYAGKMVQAAVTRIASRGKVATNTKTLMEEMASQVPQGDVHMFVLGMFVGRIVAEAEFSAMQMAAMKQAQEMLGGMGLGGVLSALGGSVPNPKSLLDRLRPKRDGAENDN